MSISGVFYSVRYLCDITTTDGFIIMVYNVGCHVSNEPPKRVLIGVAVKVDTSCPNNKQTALY